MPKPATYIIILLCACIVSVSFAQNSGKKVFSISTSEDDEPKIQTLYQNPQGYIFAGTSAGLFRFDGISFFQYQADTVLNAAVTAICDTGKNHLWVGYDNGVIATVNGNKISLVNFEEGFPKVAIKKILYETGTLWIATAGEGLYYYKNKHLYNINTDDGLSDDYIYDIVVNNAGNIIAATDRGLNIISLKDGKKNVTSYTSKNGLTDNIVRSLYTSPGGFIWLGMQDAGMACYTSDIELQSVSKQWQYGQVNAVIATSSQVYLGTEDNGLVVFDHDNLHRLTTFVYNDTDPKKISCLLRDRENNIWAASDNHLIRTAGSNIEMLNNIGRTAAEKIHSLLHSTDNSIWYNTSDGVTKMYISNGKWQQKNYVLNNLQNSDISSLFEDNKGNIWIGTLGKGVIILDPKTGKEKAIKEDSILAIGNVISISGKDSTVWISCFEGVVHATITAGGIKFQNITDVQSLGSSYINYILADNNNRVWFATDGKGVTLFENGRFTNFHQQFSKFGNVIYRIVQDPLGHIWYSTYKNGIIKYDGKIFTNFTTVQGLSDININGLAIARDNIIVLHKNKFDIINCRTSAVTYVDDEQGVGNINTDLNAYTSDENGNLYFVSDSSICKYHASYNAALQPTVHIDGIQLFLQDVNVSRGHKFKYNENNISFAYTGLYYSQTNRILYQYKLEGYDKNWVNTKDRVKNFPQLPPGTYTFRVRASLNDNFNNASEDSFVFTIEKPFWVNAWFIIACVVASLGLIFAFIKAREKSIDKFNKLEREKIRSQLETLRSQINPHFLFNSFNTLISEIEENPDNAVKYVEKLSDFYRSIVINREKDLIPLYEELDILFDYAYIQEKRYGRAIQIVNKITKEQASAFYIAPLALQLLIENAIKHNVVSFENPLIIELFVEQGNYLVVRNNINKKITIEKGGGMGLQNIQKRYELFSARPVLIENNDLFFTVKIPLLKN